MAKFFCPKPILTLSFVALISFTALFAEDELLSSSDPREAVSAVSESESGTIPEDGDDGLLRPSNVSDKLFEGETSNDGLVWAVYLFLLMAGVIVGLWYFNKRGFSGIRKLSQSNELNVRETKALGNRQFLVVVEYGEQRMLLGVAPGMINHLCYLEKSISDGELLDEKVDDTPDTSSGN